MNLDLEDKCITSAWTIDYGHYAEIVQAPQPNSITETTVLYLAISAEWPPIKFENCNF
jgi:hypothetical protein